MLQFHSHLIDHLWNPTISSLAFQKVQPRDCFHWSYRGCKCNPESATESATACRNQWCLHADTAGAGSLTR